MATWTTILRIAENRLRPDISLTRQGTCQNAVRMAYFEPNRPS